MNWGANQTAVQGTASQCCWRLHLCFSKFALPPSPGCNANFKMTRPLNLWRHQFAWPWREMFKKLIFKHSSNSENHCTKDHSNHWIPNYVTSHPCCSSALTPHPQSVPRMYNCVQMRWISAECKVGPKQSTPLPWYLEIKGTFSEVLSEHHGCRKLSPSCSDVDLDVD